MPSVEPSEYGLRATDRLEMFSDGVLAIAITLLIIEVHVPETHGRSLWHALGHQWPSYAAYLVSFLTIGIMWVNHHIMFESIARTDRAFLYLNLALLAGIAALPFPTAVLAHYIRDGNNATAAAVLYGLTMVAIGLCFTAMIFYLRYHPRLLEADVEPAGVRNAARMSAFGPLAYGVSTLVALVSAYAALALFGIIAVFFAVGSHTRESTGESANAPAAG